MIASDAIVGADAKISGAIEVAGDIKQPLTGDGAAKAGARVECSRSGSQMVSFFNNVNSNPITVEDGTLADRTTCVITVPFDLRFRYLVATPLSGFPPEISVFVSAFNPFDNTIEVYIENSGLNFNCEISLLVF